MVGQPIQQRARQAFGSECFRPLLERQIAGDERGAALIALRDQLDQQFSPSLAQRHKAQLINDQQFDLGQLPLQSQQPLLIAGGQIGRRAGARSQKLWRHSARPPSPNSQNTKNYRTHKMSYNVLRAAEAGETSVSPATLAKVKEHLSIDGWASLRGFEMDMKASSAITSELCKTITFDPARENTDKNTQKVDAGLGPIGLHIENGNTPVCPDLVAFYSSKATFEGSQTIICDERRVFEAFSDAQTTRWSQRMTVTRTLPEVLWKRYLANEHPAISEPEEVTHEHILQFKASIPDQDFTLEDDGSLEYTLKVAPVHPSSLSNGRSFANSILGPSHNYEPPVYTLDDGADVTSEEKEELREIAETCTVEITWQHGDVAVIDNTRVMHGRRAIKDQNRQLFIGMGRF